MSLPSVSIITATCYDHRLAFMNLYNSVKQQHYKNIKEWIVYNSTGAESQADFAKFFASFERKFYMNIDHKIEIKVLNNGSDRVTDREDCNIMNDLTDAATSDIVVVMSDRDQYSPIRVSSAVNAMKSTEIAFNKEQFIYSHDRDHDSVFIVNTLTGVNNFASSLAFRKNIINESTKFDEIDSIYDTVFGILGDRTDDEIGQIANEKSYMVYKTFDCDDKMWDYIPHSEYSYALKRRLSNTEKMLNKLLSNKSAMVIVPTTDECPVCFSDTNCRLQSCKHTICATCIDMLTTPCCPMCRNEFKNLNFGVWNMEYWVEDEEDDEEEDEEEEEEDEDDDEEELIEMEEEEEEEDMDISNMEYLIDADDDDYGVQLMGHLIDGDNNNNTYSMENEDAEEMIPIRNGDRIRFNNELLSYVFDPVRIDNMCALYGLTHYEYFDIIK